MVYTTENRYRTLDYVTYDLMNDNQNLAYEDALVFLKDMICTMCLEINTYREYKAYNLSDTPIHPNRSDFGYEKLKDGSIIYDVKQQRVFMFSSIPNDGVGEWIEQ